MATHETRQAAMKATATAAKGASAPPAAPSAAKATEGGAVTALAVSTVGQATAAAGVELFVPRPKGELVQGASIDDIDERVDAVEGEVVSGGFAGPMWVPHYSQFRDEIIAEKLGKLNPGSSARKTIAGQLVMDMAWGRMLYFVDVPLRAGGAARVHIPEHASLYGSLGNVRVGGVVKLTFAGFGKAKPNQAAPCLYEVALPNAPRDLLPKKREDALVPEKKNEVEQGQTDG